MVHSDPRWQARAMIQCMQKDKILCMSMSMSRTSMKAILCRSNTLDESAIPLPVLFISTSTPTASHAVPSDRSGVIAQITIVDVELRILVPPFQQLLHSLIGFAKWIRRIGIFRVLDEQGVGVRHAWFHHLRGIRRNGAHHHHAPERSESVQDAAAVPDPRLHPLGHRAPAADEVLMMRSMMVSWRSFQPTASAQTSTGMRRPRRGSHRDVWGGDRR
mmetsp:Transcript_12277/g.33750  ORF Transcript_12277/g.33750 Transcript_12277/m.33750 type:complete len:217 (+) Transcript_12277:24-674(+)